MSAPPDAMTQILQGLLGDQQQAPQGGLMGALNQALAPYGGSNQVALSLLGNKSGGSSFGSILGQSLQDSQKSSLDLQSDKLKLAQQALQMPAALYRAKLMQQLQGGGSPGTTLGGIQPMGGAPQMSPQAQPGPQGMSAGAPQQGQPSTPIPQEQQPAPAPSDFDVPKVDLGSIPVNGMSPQQANAAQQILGKDVDPVAAAEGTRKAQLQVAQAFVAPKLARLDSIIKSANPTAEVSADPKLTALWREMAPQIGADPNSAQSFTAGNVRQALGIRRNQIAAWGQQAAAEIPAEHTTETDADGAVYDVDPITKKRSQISAEALKQVVGKDGKPVYVPANQAVGKQAYNAAQFNLTQSTPQSDRAKQLDAALAVSGYVNPQLRPSSKGYAQRLQNILDQSPDTPIPVLAQQMRDGVFDFSGAKKSVTQLSSAMAATNQASIQLEGNFKALDPLVAKMGSTSIPIIDRSLAQLRQNFETKGDKDTASFVTNLRAATSEYAKIISGGVGNAAPSVEDQKEAMSVMKNAWSEGGYQGLRDALTGEAARKKQSYAQAIADAKGGSGPAAGPAPTKNAQGWVLHKDAQGNQAYVSPDGKNFTPVQ